MNNACIILTKNLYGNLSHSSELPGNINYLLTVSEYYID